MTTHITGTRKEWLAKRLELLEAEKELTRRGDELARRRQELPWVRLDKAYRFDTDEGNATLGDLFRGRSQLLVYHYMFGPDYTAGCATCSTIADGFNGFAVHLANHDVMLWAVSRASLAKLQAYKRRLGWTFPWASSSAATSTSTSRPRSPRSSSGIGRYNYRREPALKDTIGDTLTKVARGRRGQRRHDGADVATYTRERPGMSAVRARGRRHLPHVFGLCARPGCPRHVPVARPRPQGRNESGMWWRRHDEYETQRSA